MRGQRVGRYELVQPIGEGSIASVWAARDGERVVALKLIHSRYADDPVFRALFLEMAEAVRRIDHPNVARVLDVGEDRLFLVTEHVDGESLFTLLAPQRVAPLPVALRIAADVCAALEAARAATEGARPLVHRDVSPQNVLLSLDGQVKVTDFGIAEARDRAAATTDMGSVKGKVRYMAPEQARGEVLSPSTDVFGAGAVLFRMLAGRAPYAAGNDLATMQALLGDRPPLVSLPDDVPPRVRAILDRALAPKPADRYARATEMRADLEAALGAQTADVAGWVKSHSSAAARERHAAVLGLQRTVLLPAPEPPAPAFMDVAGLVKKAPPKSKEEPRIELAVTPRARAPLPPPPRRWVRPLLVAAACVAIITTFFAVAPGLLEERAVDAARGAGFTLTIAETSWNTKGIMFKGLKARAIAAPGVTASIDEVFFAGFSGREMRVTGVNLALTGRSSELETVLRPTIASARARLGERHVVLAKARASWEGLHGPGTRADVGDLALELDARGSIVDVHGHGGALTYDRGTAHFGPWDTSFDFAAAGSRIRAVFDPAEPDGPNAFVVWSALRPYDITVNVRRTPIARLGLPAVALGWPVDGDGELEVQARGLFPRPPAKGDLHVDATLGGARVEGFASPIDIHVDANVVGVLGEPLSIERTNATVGPFVAAVGGVATASAEGLRLDLNFKTVPVPCSNIARAQAKSVGPFAELLRGLGERTGAVRVTGSVYASGSATYDTAAPGARSVVWTTRETCGLSFFGL
jgi:hypothetical protein